MAAALMHALPTVPNLANAAPWSIVASRVQRGSRQASRTGERQDLIQQSPALVRRNDDQIIEGRRLTDNKQQSKAILPECLQELRPSAFSLPGVQAPIHTAFTIRNSVAAMPRGVLDRANLLSRHSMFRLSTQRQMSSISAFQRQPPKTPFTKAVGLQRRSLFAGHTSVHNLAHMEETANRNPSSATAQNAFYQALIRANMPAIVVERYQAGGFATNAACEAAYQKALSTLHSGGDSGFGGQNYSNAQVQAIGQAVAAQSKGGNVAVSRGQGTGTGAKDSPLYVVVEETIGGVIFKWTKFLLYFALVCYLTLMVISLAVEALSSFSKKLGGKGENEAKAEHHTVRFSDVHGCDEAKEELQELVDFLKNPEAFSTLGGKLPKGVLLVGPPGTGKTLLARAVAGEAGVPFFFMSGSEFDEIYVGVGAKRVRELFAAAKAKSPAIVFIDELDAIGGKRNAKDAAYVKQTLNQLLTELDGFEQNSGVIILAATNFPEMLDKALTRPGRFDRNVVVGLPDVRGRIAILKHHMKNVVAGKDVDLEALAAGTPGFSGAELENVINQAAVHASKAKAQAVSMMDFEWAKDKVMMGAEKKSMVISPKEKEMTAYHEAGHALVCMFTKGANPLHKITVMPRGQALGMTTHLPEIDKYSMSMDEYQAHIDVCLGGKIAEELIYGEDKVTSGVASVRLLFAKTMALIDANNL